MQPQVRLWAERSDGNVKLFVQDSGIGIETENLERIFAPFERLHGKQTYPGTGLGLAIVRKGAQRMGGRAGVDPNSERAAALGWNCSQSKLLPVSSPSSESQVQSHEFVEMPRQVSSFVLS